MRGVMWRVFRAASIAAVIVFSLVLLTGGGLAQAQNYWEWTSNGTSTDINDPGNWLFGIYNSYGPFPACTGVNANIVTGSSEPVNATSRWGFNGQGGWSTACTNWYTGSPSVNYPSIRNPQTCTVGPSDSDVFTNNNGGGIGGDMHIVINGGTLDLADAGITMNDSGTVFLLNAAVYGAKANQYSFYQFPDSIDVSNGGYFSATSAYSFFTGGASAAGDLWVGIHDSGTISIPDYFAAGHSSSTGGITPGGGSAGAGNTNNGLGAGGLTLQGAGGSVNIGTVELLPASGGTSARNAYTAGGVLNVVLDSTNVGGAFNTCYTNKLEIDSTYTVGATSLASAVNLQVTLAGYTPVLNDVFPIISINGGSSSNLEQYVYGTGLVTGSLGGIDFNGQAAAWGTQFGVGTATFNYNTFEYDYPAYMTAYEYNPNNVSQAGVYLEVTGVTSTPEPSTLVLLGVGALGAAVVAYRRKRRAG